jgi:hypothetical protein
VGHRIKHTGRIDRIEMNAAFARQS